MEGHVRALGDLLSQKLLEAPYDPSGITPEHDTVRKLMGIVSEHDIGNVGWDEMREIFKNHRIPNFDIDQWLSERIAEGIYTDT